jgi:DNA-directed RNA polymerase subunit RPC12/RpoP
MQILLGSDYNLFKNIVSINQDSLKKTLRAYIEKHYKNFYFTENYLIGYGDIQVALVAHMDTVFTKLPQSIYYDREQGVIWSPEGLGADDRAGVFAILKILESGLRPTVIFTTDEENGCIGAEFLVNDFPEDPIGLKYIIELDRRGTNDCVFYECDNKDFVKYVEQFGFIVNFGTLSDISVICPAWKVAGVNLSVGYEDEHSKTETLHTAPLLRTISNVKNMLQQENIPFFKYVPCDNTFFNWSAWRSFQRGCTSKSYDDYNYWFDDEDTIVKCEKCKKLFADYETIPVKRADGKIVHYCTDHCSDLEWCSICGEAFELATATNKQKKKILCPSCAYGNINNEKGKVRKNAI